MQTPISAHELRAIRGPMDPTMDAKPDGDSSVAQDGLTRRQFAIGSATTAAALATTGTAAAQESTATEPSDVLLDYRSEFIQTPQIGATVSVERTGPDMSQFEYVADDDSTASLRDDGFDLVDAPDDETPHNPVTIKASNILADEFREFPRGITYDDDSDSNTSEIPVSALDATHWSLSQATNGSLSVSDGERDSLIVSSSSVADGETVSATLDLSTVGSSDGTITSGMSRKFIQLLTDIDTLTSGATVEIALVGSDGVEVTASIDPAGDSSTAGVLSTSTGDSQVLEARVGELETDQGVSLADIQQVVIRINDADAALQIHGLNAERSSRWTFGREEYAETRDDGSTTISTRDVVGPRGTFGVTDLGTLPEIWAQSDILSVTYDAVVEAESLASEQVLARSAPLGETYNYDESLEYLYTFTGPSAYSIESLSFDSMTDEAALAGSRYLRADVATGVTAPETWDDADAISWTDRTDQYSQPGAAVELLSTVNASDTTVVRFKTQHSSDEIGDATRSGGVAVASGGDGGGMDGSLVAILGALFTGMAGAIARLRGAI